ncbi:MAG TPA: hypothetical protein DIW23_01380 [Anaerolineae bacterium]|nr:hypothetical protein [Anaerolineae bacterium]
MPVQIIRKQPIIILLIINLLIGIFTFQDYGYSWDEPLFYEYADALQYAYSPKEWFSGIFDLQNAFGASASDHANRGPAYIIIVYPIVSFFKLFFDNASSWHLINFLTFQLGVYLFYRFASRFVETWSAFLATVLFASQPIFWGHSFINPKDIPFLVFFIGSMCFGFEMVDDFVAHQKINFWKILLASFFMGIATSIRVLGPLAALLIGLYALIQIKQLQITNYIKLFAMYGILSLLISFLSWPYLWINPLQTFIQVFAFMSDNPTQLNVLFMGNDYQAGEVPRRYILTLLGYTQTEVVWILFLLGLFLSFWKSNNQKRITLFIILLWFAIPLAYVLLRRPSMYDGYRHFLFILPPIFIFAGFAFEKLFEFIKNQWIRIASLGLILLFGIIPIIQLHPYQYAYYNNFIGGVGGAFRNYETEYWLTCYREAVLELNEITNKEVNLFVRREPYIADYYANENITIRDFRTEQSQINSGDYYLVNTRSNEDLRFMRDVPALITVERQGAQFCLIKQVP